MAEEEMKMEVESELEARPKLELEIMATVQVARETNGLRHFDYQRYRTYCASRLRRMRKNRNIRFMYGKGRQFVEHKLTAEEATDVRHLMIPLFNAERAWGYAMEIEDKINNRMNNNEEFPQRWYLHLNRRLSKAAKWSMELRELCAQVADDRTELEARAYCSMMQGWMLDNKGQFQAALTQYNLAKSVFEQLHKIGSPSQQEVFTSVLERINARIQYCEYSLQHEQGMTLEAGAGMDVLGDEMLRGKLERVMAKARKDNASESTSIKWKGREVPIRSEKIRITLLQAADHARELDVALESMHQRQRNESVDSQAGADGNQVVTVEGLLSKVISEYDSALREAQSEEQRVNKQKAGAKQSHLIDELKDLKDYIRMHYYRKQILRYFMLADSLESRGEGNSDTDKHSPSNARKRTRMDQSGTAGKTNPKAVEFIRMFDKILASYDELEALFAGDESEESSSVVAECGAMSMLSKAYRTFHAGRSYSEQEKWSEATVLFDQALSTASAAKLKLDGLPKASEHESNRGRLVSLMASVKSARCVAIANSFIKRFKEDEALASGVKQLELKQKVHNMKPRFLVDRLEDPEVNNPEERFAIYALPPNPVAVACRPTLLDRAFSSIDMPDLDSRTGKKITKNRTSPSANVSETNSPSSSQQSGWLDSATKWFSR